MKTRKLIVGLVLGAVTTWGIGAAPASALTLYQASNPTCGSGYKLRTLAYVNGPYVDHGIGPSSGSLTFVRRNQNSSVTKMNSNVRWAYRSAGYMRINTAGNITSGSSGGANCWR